MRRIAIFLAMIIIIFSLFPFSQARGLTVDIYGPATVGTTFSSQVVI